MCPKRGIDRFVDGSKSIPWKVLQRFPLIPRLLRMYRCKSLAELLTWHKDGISTNGLVCSVVNSLAWKHVNDKWPTFATDGCSIRLGLALDGVNPFGDLSSRHSIWPMILLNYNLLPWLVIKQYFFMLAFNHSWERICNIHKCGCVPTTID